MGPPVMRPVLLQCRESIEILELSESDESRSGDDIDA